MICEKIFLPVNYSDKIKTSDKNPFINTYILDNFEALDPDRKRPLVVICPGGGYGHLSPREGEAIAIKMNSMGYHAVVLNYSLAPMEWPQALCDLAEAVYYCRCNADKWHVDVNKIIVGGFSAGGHLAASLGCYWNASLLKQYLPYPQDSYKPNALMLCYPVITAEKELCHPGSIVNVLGDSHQDNRDAVSLEKHVNSDVPPVFMWHTVKDQSVPAENSMLFAIALRKAGVDFEYHLFNQGLHGLALATAETSKKDGSAILEECAVWPELFNNWLKTLWPSD